MIHQKVKELKDRKNAIVCQVNKLLSEIEEINRTLEDFNAFDDKSERRLLHLIELEMCHLWEIDRIDLRLKDRHKEIMWKKHIIRWVFRRKVHISYTEIAGYYQNDHSTVIHSIKVVDNAFQYPSYEFIRQFEPVKEYIDAIYTNFPQLIPEERYKLLTK